MKSTEKVKKCYSTPDTPQMGMYVTRFSYFRTTVTPSKPETDKTQDLVETKKSVENGEETKIDHLTEAGKTKEDKVKNDVLDDKPTKEDELVDTEDDVSDKSQEKDVKKEETQAIHIVKVSFYPTKIHKI